MAEMIVSISFVTTLANVTFSIHVRKNKTEINFGLVLVNT